MGEDQKSYEQLSRENDELREQVERLQKRSARFLSSAEKAFDIVFRFTILPKRNLDYISANIFELTGYSLAELQSNPELAANVIHPEDRSRLCQTAGSKEKSIDPLVLRWQKKDGSIIWMEQFNMPFFDNEGRTVLIEGVARDITARRKAENEISLLHRELERRAWETENIFRAVTNSAADSIFCKDLAQRYTLVNPAMERLLGLPADKIISHKADDLFDAEAVAFINELDQQALRGQLVDALRTIHIDGKPFTFHVIESPLRDGNGNVQGICGIVSDVTAYQKTEEKLRDSEERFKAQFQSIPVPTYIWQKTDGDFILAGFNNAAEKITNGKIGEYLGKNASEMYRDQPDILQDIHRCFHEKVTVDREMAYQMQSIGQKRQLAVKYANVPPDCVLVHTEDITERKNADENLRKSEEKFRALAEKSSDTIMRFDRYHRHLYANPAVEVETNIPAADFIGKTHEELGFPPDLCALWAEAIDTVFDTKKSHRIEFQLPTGVWIDWLLNPELSANGEVVAVMTYARNITEIKKAEDQIRDALIKSREAEMLKSTFLSHMSHEIRTPLNHIIGLSSIIQMERKKLTGKEIDNYLRIVRRSAESLLDIINTVLDLSKIETGRFDTVAAPFNIIIFLEEIAERFATEALAKSLQFSCNFDHRIPPKLMGDSYKLERVLNNLLGNAMKFTSAGNVSLEVKELSRHENDIELYFRVQDTGIGIPPAQHEKIFQAFYQVDMSSTREYRGTGLGLTIARELIRLIGGDIWLESEPGSGTTFHFTCRFKIAEK